MAACPEFENCVNRRIADGEFRGMVIAKLDNIEKQQETIGKNQVAMQKSINKLYVKVAGVSATASFLVLLVFKVIGK